MANIARLELAKQVISEMNPETVIDMIWYDTCFLGIITQDPRIQAEGLTCIPINKTDEIPYIPSGHKNVNILYEGIKDYDKIDSDAATLFFGCGMDHICIQWYIIHGTNVATPTEIIKELDDLISEHSRKDDPCDILDDVSID